MVNAVITSRQLDGLPLAGKVIDISRGGIAFSCLPDQKRLCVVSELDIVVPRPFFSMNKLQSKVISSCNIAGEGSDESATTRCGIQFVGLTDAQKHSLDNFIRGYT